MTGLSWPVGNQVRAMPESSSGAGGAVTTFAHGEAVTYRELWRNRVMTAIPMRVIRDGEHETVLYLAAGTEFLAGRAPDGGPIRDLDDWISVRQAWTGGSAIRIVPADCWYSIDVEFDSDRKLVGYYVNIQTPITRTTAGFDTVDLVLDLVVAPDGTVRFKDVDDFETAVSAGHIASDEAGRVRDEAAQLSKAIKARGEIARMKQWADWRPPHSWQALTLTQATHHLTACPVQDPQ